MDDEKDRKAQNPDDLELSDDDLDAVAGGALFEPTIVRMEKPTTKSFDGIDGEAVPTPTVGFETPVFRR